MKKEKILAGLDLGHIQTKAILMKGEEILGYTTLSTGFDAVASAQTALHQMLESFGILHKELGGVVATGIFRERMKESSLNITRLVPEYIADAKGALFLNKDSRTVIDLGGNIHKAIRYDQNGDLLDVIQNDKCADGLGIFYTSIAKVLGVSEQELSELALKSNQEVSIAIHCIASAESEAIDLMCQGTDIEDVASAILKFIAERVSAICDSISLKKEIVVAGGMAKSKALIKHLQSLMKQELRVSSFPEYVGAIGAVMSDEG